MPSTIVAFRLLRRWLTPFSFNIFVDGCASTDSDPDDNLAGPSSSSSFSVQAAESEQVALSQSWNNERFAWTLLSAQKQTAKYYAAHSFSSSTDSVVSASNVKRNLLLMLSRHLSSASAAGGHRVRAKHHDESVPPSLQELMHSSIAFAGNRDSQDVCVVVVYFLTI